MSCGVTGKHCRHVKTLWLQLLSSQSFLLPPCTAEFITEETHSKHFFYNIVIKECYCQSENKAIRIWDFHQTAVYFFFFFFTLLSYFIIFSLCSAFFPRVSLWSTVEHKNSAMAIENKIWISVRHHIPLLLYTMQVLIEEYQKVSPGENETPEHPISPAWLLFH